MGQLLVSLAVLQHQRRVPNPVCIPSAPGRRLIGGEPQDFFRRLSLAAAAVENRPQLLVPEGNAAAIANLTKASSLEQQMVSLPQPQTLGSIRHILIHTQGRVHRRLQPFIALTVAHQQGQLPTGVDISERAVGRVQRSYQGTKGLLGALVVELHIHVGHGLHQ